MSPQNFEKILNGPNGILRAGAWGTLIHKIRKSRGTVPLNIELDLQSLFGLHVHSCSHWLRPCNPSPPHLGLYVRGPYW
jgi:hypothetical protein